MENLKPRKTTIRSKECPEWGTFGIMADRGDYYEIRGFRGSCILTKQEAVKFWEVVAAPQWLTEEN